jgi:serine/threonine protein kinase
VTGAFSHRVGAWDCHELLGQGGNATVWRASREGLPAVALKVLNETKLEQESYRRFQREVEIQRGLGAMPGVLPLLDSYLPEAPSKSDRAWLAMPIAIPLDRAFSEDSQLDEIVVAVATIAQTLARLKEVSGVAHRDLKPGNLYWLDGEYLIGDFNRQVDPPWLRWPKT